MRRLTSRARTCRIGCASLAFTAIAMHLSAEPIVSINLLPSDIFSQADGLFQAFDNGVVVVVGNTTPAAGKRKLDSLGYTAPRLRAVYHDALSKLDVRHRSRNEFSEAAASKEPLMLTVSVIATPGTYDGANIWAYTIESSICRKTLVPETGTLVNSTVWRTVPAIGVSANATLRDNFARALSNSIDELSANLSAARSIKRRPFTPAEFDRALEGDYPRTESLARIDRSRNPPRVPMINVTGGDRRFARVNQLISELRQILRTTPHEDAKKNIPIELEGFIADRDKILKNPYNFSAEIQANEIASLESDIQDIIDLETIEE